MDLIKKELLTIINAILWIAFLLALNDPLMVGTREAGSIYHTYAGIIDPVYQVAEMITAPVEWLSMSLGLYDPNSTINGFPQASAPQLSQMMSAYGLGGIFTTDLFKGAVLWWIPISSFIYGLLFKVLPMIFGALYERLRNWVWNIIIEYVFQRKKATLYAKELENSRANLARLNNQYRTLAQETNTLKDSVITDELTKVYNKRFFLNRLTQDFDLCKQQTTLFSLIMIDIDFFKRLNDTYGHLAGDQVLMAVGNLLGRFTPEQCYPCRYGGEEFSILMPRKDYKEAMEVARLLQKNIQALRFDTIDKKLVVTISQGICTIDFSAQESMEIRDYNMVLELADKELYRSKMEGRNRVSIYSLLKH